MKQMKITQEVVDKVVLELSDSIGIDQYSILNMLQTKPLCGEDDDNFVESVTKVLTRMSAPINVVEKPAKEAMYSYKTIDQEYTVVLYGEHDRIINNPYYSTQRPVLRRDIGLGETIGLLVTDAFIDALLLEIISKTKMNNDCIVNGVIEVDTTESDFRFVTNKVIFSNSDIDKPNMANRIKVLLNNNTTTMIGNIAFINDIEFGLTAQYKDLFLHVDPSMVQGLLSDPKYIHSIVSRLLQHGNSIREYQGRNRY